MESKNMIRKKKVYWKYSDNAKVVEQILCEQ